jgi:hypothetical protein
VTDIPGERRKLADQGLQIIRRETWGARQGYTSDRTCDVPARAFFLHISVTRLRADEHAGMREIEAIGQARFGIGCSYNAASFPSGRLYEAQPLTRRGAHTLNNFKRSTCQAHGGSLEAPSWNNNVNARALVLPQNVQDLVTDEQVDAAARWAAAQMRAGLARRSARWHGHRCVSAKDCPGSEGYGRIPELQLLTDHYVAAGLRPKPTPAPEPEDEDMQLTDKVKLGPVNADLLGQPDSTIEVGELLAATAGHAAATNRHLAEQNELLRELVKRLTPAGP